MAQLLTTPGSLESEGEWSAAVDRVQGQEERQVRGEGSFPTRRAPQAGHFTAGLEDPRKKGLWKLLPVWEGLCAWKALTSSLSQKGLVWEMF